MDSKLAIFLIVVWAIGLAIGLPSRHVHKRQVNYDVSDKEEDTGTGTGAYHLPAASNTVLTKKKVNDELVCPGPGIYADVNNNCQIFHFCVLTGRPDGSGFDLRQYSFFCGNTTIFDQYTLTCQVPEKAIPCEYAPEFYDINKRTEQGKKEVFLHKEEDKEVVEPYYDESSSRTLNKKTLNFVDEV